jgi:hypothetical protein
VIASHFTAMGGDCLPELYPETCAGLLNLAAGKKRIYQKSGIGFEL